MLLAIAHRLIFPSTEQISRQSMNSFEYTAERISAPNSPPLVNHTGDPRYYDLDDLLPAEMDFAIFGNLTANGVIKKVVGALDGGPSGISGDTAMALALVTPILLLMCVIFMSKCRRVWCLGGYCFCCWFNCTGACKTLCGGETLLSGTDPETAMQPGEDVSDSVDILGDEDHVTDPPMPSADSGPIPASSSSDTSEDDDEQDQATDSSYDKSCKQCCDTVAACLEDGTAQANGTGARGPASEAIKGKKNGKRK